MDISRRNFMKMAGLAAITAASGVNVSEAAKRNQITTQAPTVGSTLIKDGTGSRAKVYFTRDISAKSLIKLYNKINDEIYGKVAIKLHTGEPNGPNILPRDMVQAFQAQIPDSTIVECNTLYKGKRHTTADHRETLKINGWTFSEVDIMDADENDAYINLPVRGGKHLQEVAMGKHIVNYDSMVVLTHFKGHAMGGFGGSMKNIAIGCASGHLGKAQVHGVDPNNVPEDYRTWPLEDYFMELMADSAKATCDYFGKHIVFINVMRRMSVDCDCAGTRAEEPTMADIGICASTDILAIDQACCDFVYSASDSKDLKGRMESRHGLHQLAAMKNLKLGNDRYELITI